MNRTKLLDEFLHSTLLCLAILRQPSIALPAFLDLSVRQHLLSSSPAAPPPIECSPPALPQRQHLASELLLFFLFKHQQLVRGLNESRVKQQLLSHLREVRFYREKPTCQRDLEENSRRGGVARLRTFQVCQHEETNSLKMIEYLAHDCCAINSTGSLVANFSTAQTYS